jgi:hypothetical protein
MQTGLMTKLATMTNTVERASEIKFLVDPAVAAGIREWARIRLEPDPHGSGPDGDEYLVASLYFDTEDFAVFRRHGSYGRSKYRIRRYNGHGPVFLERKMRTSKVLSKRRTPVASEDLGRLTDRAVDCRWEGAWFQERLRVRRFGPISQVSYHRTARMAGTTLGPIRLTVDDDLRALPASGLMLRPLSGDIVLHDTAIVEMKFRIAMPVVFKELAEKFKIEPRRVSKYNVTAIALGLASPPGTHEVLADGKEKACRLS